MEHVFQIGHPAALFEQALLHVEALMDHVKARMAGGQLNDLFLTRLLLGNLLKADLDAGHGFEIRQVFLNDVGTRTFDQRDFKGRARKRLPVHPIRKRRTPGERGGSKPCGPCQEVAPIDDEFGHLDFLLPRRSLSGRIPAECIQN